MACCNSAIKSIEFDKTSGGGLCKYVSSDRFGGGGGGILRIGVPKFVDAIGTVCDKLKIEVGLGNNFGVIKV